MVNRREFLKTSIGAVAALSLSDLAFAEGKHIPLGVQLYTVRNQAESNLPALLKQIRQIGYEEVETYWNVYTHPAAELKAMITDAGLRVPSGHFDYDGLESKLDYAKELGVQYVICPMLPKSMWNSPQGFQQAATQFNKWGERVRKMGMTFGFHNHNYEFQQFGGDTGFGILMGGTDPKLVKLEMDCYWITQAGRSPVDMLKEYRDRIRMLHLKDRKKGFPPSQTLNDAAMHFTEVGNGTIDWKAILTQAQAQGIEHYFVEQDESDKNPVESIRISYNYLRKILP